MRRCTMSMHGTAAMAEAELNLDQLLADPLVRLVMSSDAVQESDIRQLASRTRFQTQARQQTDFHDAVQERVCLQEV